jgi:UTP--glucose-1-phosphate uridylyltransferase
MIKKAIIPAAGWGTRMLPATKSIPKEMLPILDKPVIQYVVEEAANSGITDILIVISSGKRAIEEHFSNHFELEYTLKEKGKKAELETLRKIQDLANIHFVWQRELNGLGDAVRYGKTFVGKDPFAILLGDSILESNTNKPILLQMIEKFETHHASITAVREVPKALVSRYGIMSGMPTSDADFFEVKEWIEKPSPEEAPSNLAVAGAYIFTPTIFELLEKTTPGKNNEIQLTDAMHALLQKEKMYALKFDGTRYDIGNRLDFIKTNLIFGLRSPEFGHDLKMWLKDLL